MSLSAPPVVEKPLFFLDYDGTLAPIVDDPKAAHPHPGVPAVLARLGAAHPLYLVTGRHLDDLALFLDEPHEAIGLHGTQRGRVGGPVESRLPDEAVEAIAAMRARLPEVEGVSIEEKGPSFAVHYRRAPDPEAARGALQDWLAVLPDVLEAIPGKMVFELRPKGFSKGVAVRDVAARHPARTPLYLGDDVTDEDAFEALGDDGVTVKVGDGPTAARYRLPDVDAVVAYLERYG